MPSGGEAGRLRGLFDGVSDTVGWPSGSVVAGVVCLPRESSLEPLTGPLPSPVDKFPLVVGRPAQGLEARQFAASRGDSFWCLWVLVQGQVFLLLARSRRRTAGSAALLWYPPCTRSSLC